MSRSYKGIRENLKSMKKADNAWADRYVRDVGWLLRRTDEAKALLRECLPHVLSSAEADRMMDGFEPKEHESDRLATQMLDAIDDAEFRAELRARTGRPNL